MSFVPWRGSECLHFAVMSSLHQTAAFCYHGYQTDNQAHDIHLWYKDAWKQFITLFLIRFGTDCLQKYVGWIKTREAEALPHGTTPYAITYGHVLFKIMFSSCVTDIIKNIQWYLLLFWEMTMQTSRYKWHQFHTLCVQGHIHTWTPHGLGNNGFRHGKCTTLVLL